MKIKKIAPVIAASLLLVGCGSSGVKTMKKPSFAKYSNEVDAQGFTTALGEESKKLLDLFVTEGEGDAKTIKGLKNGLTRQSEQYSETKGSGKSAGGLKFESKTQHHQDYAYKVDKANKRVNTKTVSDTASTAKNGTLTGGYRLIGENSNVLVANDPYYLSMTSNGRQKSESETQTEIVGEKAKSIDVSGKQFITMDLPAQYDVEFYIATSEYQNMIYTAMELANDVPSFFDAKDVKYYVDGDLFTVFAEKDFSGTAKYGEVEYTSKAKVSFIAQIDYAKLEFAESTELSVDQSSKEGTVKVEEKEYKKGSFVNKDVTLKAIDTAKFTNLDA